MPRAARLAAAALAAAAVLTTADQPSGGWRCCRGIESCDDWTAESCAAVEGCTTQATCTTNCGSQGGGGGLWCRTEPCDSKGDNCASSLFDENLRLPVRPPRQTADQARAMHAIQERAVRDSAAARAWVLSYFGSAKVRQNLDASLQQHSDEELLVRNTPPLRAIFMQLKRII